MDARNGGDKKTLASGFVNALVRELCAVAIDAAEARGIADIGITGGVSYNLPIVEMVERELKRANYDLVRHNKVPNGDAGISVGQCSILQNLI